jgi:two-component system torCAD operon response regulator TorR
VHRPRLLLVENEQALHRPVGDALAAEGYRVTTVSTIAEFRKIGVQDYPDLYIIDQQLPDGNGISLVKEISLRCSCGIVVLSRSDTEADHVLSLELGADDYIVKPVRIRELVARVGAVLRRCARSRLQQRSAVSDMCFDFSFDGYRVNCAARQLISPAGAEIALTTAEFDLLIALLRSRGSVCHRDRILTLMKGRAWTSSDRIIDGLVSRLRRKIPTNNAKHRSYIRTVHGVGYAFVTHPQG